MTTKRASKTPPPALRSTSSQSLASSSDSSITTPSTPQNKSSSIPSKKARKNQDSSNVKVLVRVRPRIEREQTSPLVIEMKSDEKTTVLLPKPNTPNSEEKTFHFDHSLWSVDQKDSKYKSQEDTFNVIGKEILEHTLNGFNTCIFAYGQTGSGKSYTMMGDDANPGIIPLTCFRLWENVKRRTEQRQKVNVKVSYFEVYNEQVLDLLGDDHAVKLKVRENPKSGPYVEGLTEFEITDFEHFAKYLEVGNRNRTVAATKMNDNSSRSHAVFTVSLRIREFSINESDFLDKDDYIKETSSSLRLVDLAGSERVTSTGATGVRMKEGTNINKSLTTLGRVILSLSDGVSKPPYRDSTLTWLLKENLGGNSKTAMIACVSPCDYDESLSTLRYAMLTKNVKLIATANIDEIQGKDNSEEFKQMKAEIEKLTDSLNEAQKNEELIQRVTNLSRFFEDRLNEQREKYSIIKQDLIQSKNEKMRYEKSLNVILNAFNEKTIDYEEVQLEFAKLAERSQRLGGSIAEDLERFKLVE